MEAGAAPRISQTEMKLVGLTAMIMTITVCSENTGPDVGPPAQLLIVSSNEQQEVVGSDLGEPLIVRALDADDEPVPGVDVSWSVRGGGGSLSQERSVTDESGEATTVWTLGTEPGENHVEAEIEGLDPVTFTATALVGPPGQLEIVSGDGQEGVAESVLPDSLVVRVADGFGNPVPNAEVGWQVTEGDGSVSPGTSTTNDLGEARTEWTTGAAGPQEVSAQVEGLDEVTFTAVAEVEEDPEPEPDQIRIVSGDGQEAEVGTKLPDRLVVEVLDGDDNPLPDIEVAWAVDSGSVMPEMSTTNDSGQASTEWTLGDEPGEVEATATVEGLDVVTFTATAHPAPPGPPANIEVVTGAPDSTVIDQALADSLAVRITDADGVPVPDVEVSWEVHSFSELAPAGLSSISPAASLTDSDGVARAEWTIGTDPHIYFAEAFTGSGLSEMFETLAYLPVGSKLEAASSTDQTISVGERGDSIIVRLTDGDGNPLSDVVVNWDYNKAPNLEHIAGHRTAALSPIRRRLTIRSPDAQRILERRAIRAMSLAIVPTDENGEAAFVPGPFREPGEYVIGARLEGNDVGIVVREIEFTVTVEP